MNQANQKNLQDNIKKVLNLFSIGKVQEALKKVEALKDNHPNNALLFNISGVCLKALGQLDSAISHFKVALEIKPNYFEVSFNLALTLKQSGNLSEAVKNFRIAIRNKPDYPEAHANLADTLKQLGHFQDAIISYKKTLSIRPNFAEAHNNLGNIFMEINQPNDAKICFERAVEIKPNFAQALNNIGNIMRGFGQIDNAYKFYLKAAKLEPNFAEVLNNLGIILVELGQHHLAIDYYSNAIAKKNNFAEAHANLGSAYKRIKKLNNAIESFQKANKLNPKLNFIFGDLVNTKMNLCLWKDLSRELEDLEIKINNNEKTIRPFPSLALIVNPTTQKKVAEIFAKDRFHQSSNVSKLAPNPKDKRVRIGYFSPDLRNHAVASLISELFEIHDREQFEVHAFYFGPDTDDEMNLSIKSAVDFYYDIRSLGHKEVATLAREIKLDIAVDLCGYTQDCRPEIFAERAAPIQISYLGYPGTMGAKFIDYIIADRIIIPEKNQKFYTEKIIYMPNSYQVNMSKKNITDETFSRQELGLPISDFVFCCFNNTFKITPSIFSSWMQILLKVDKSVLWLYKTNDSVATNLKKEASKFGINPNRLVFAHYKPGIDNFSNRIKLADLFLDTLPYNAHTMASDTLRMGVPVLTCMGETLASRVAASLLHASNMPELVTENKDEYVSMAIELASNRAKYKEIKDKLLKNIPISPLYDSSLFARNLETAFKKTYEKSQNKQKTDHIFVTN